MTPEQQAAVVAEANSWLRTPYHHAAGMKGVGVDCAYLLIETFHACGFVPKIDPGYYPLDYYWHNGDERYLGWVQEYAEQVETPMPGDVVLYKFGRCISHGAIVIDWPLIVHAVKGEGVVYGDGTVGRMAGRLVGFWRVRA